MAHAALSSVEALVALLCIYLSTFVATAVFVPKSRWTLRAFLGVCVGVEAILLQDAAQGHITNDLLKVASAGSFGIHYLSLIELVAISRVDANDLAALAKSTATPSILGLIWQALCLSINFRRVGTQWQQIKIQERHVPQSTSSFIGRSIAYTLFCYVVVDAMTSGPLPDGKLITPEKEVVFTLWTLSLEDVGFRIGFTMVFWGITYLFMALMVNVLAILSVALGVSTPSAWPPLNGSLSSAFTIRLFWGEFWHQVWRVPLTQCADFISNQCLRLPRKTFLSRYTRLTLAFFLSGVLHYGQDHAVGMSLRQSGTISFFLLQSLGIMLEDQVQAMTATWGISSRTRRYIGYCWVLVFLCSTTPTWGFPKLRHQSEPSGFPFSIASMFMQ